MKILGIIPARIGSKGVKKKNIKLLNGKPLISYTYENAKNSKQINRLIVSTESKEIKKVCTRLGLDVPFLRPSALSMDDTPTIDVVKHAIKEMEKNGEYYGAICLLQTTTPFRDKNLIDSAIKKFKIKNCDSLVSVQKVPNKYHPNWMFQSDGDGFLYRNKHQGRLVSRRQDLDYVFYRDGSLYLTATKTIKNHSDLYGNKIAFIEHKPVFHVNIDTNTDWEKAEKYSKAI